MADTLRDEADQLFSELAIEVGKPSPPDPYLRATVRMRQAHVIAKQFASDLVALERELVAMTDRVILLRRDAMAWLDVVKSYADQAAGTPNPWADKGQRWCACGRACSMVGDTVCLGCLLVE